MMKILFRQPSLGQSFRNYYPARPRWFNHSGIIDPPALVGSIIQELLIRQPSLARSLRNYYPARPRWLVRTGTIVSPDLVGSFVGVRTAVSCPALSIERKQL